MDNDEVDYIVRGPPLDYVAEYTSVGKFVFNRLHANPGFIGQIEAHTGHEYSHAEILDRSIRFALWLRDMDIKPGDVVGYATSIHKDMVIVLYGVLFVGAVLSPWDSSLSPQRFAYFMDRTKPKIVICSKDAAISVKTAAEELHVTPVFVVHGESSGFIPFEDTQVRSKIEICDFQCADAEENDVALLVCTSGTSALPKIMQRTNKSILMIVKRMEKSLSAGSVFMTFAPLCWVSGIHAALRGPSAKLQCVLASYFDEESTLEWIEKYKVNFAIMATPMSLRMVYHVPSKRYDISSLQTVILGGSILHTSHYAKFREFIPEGCKIFQTYGTTETAGGITLTTPGSNPGSCGRFLAGGSGKIIDPRNGKTISPHELGELCIKHPAMFSGYYNNDSAPTNLALDSDGWFHTGDLAKFNMEGELFVIDRLKDIIDVNGHRMFPSELETILMQHPEIKNVGVVGKRVSSTVEHPVAFVVKSLGSNVTEKEIRNFVKSQDIPHAKQLSLGVRFIHKIPCSPSGKIQRWKLRRILESEI